jgi:hypothetical protein
MPLYRDVKAGTPAGQILVALGGQVAMVDVSTTTSDGARTVFIAAPAYFEREYLYGAASRDYPDNPERFAFLSQAALTWALAVGGKYDIVHAHDWQTGLVPLMLRRLTSDWGGAVPATVFTIHNLAYQGVFDASWLPRLGLEWDLLRLDALEYWNRISFLKGGIGCHVNRFEVTDPASGNFVFQATGHQFEAVPCVDAQGVPDGQTDCAFTAAARNWSSCTASGCHATQTIAANVYNASKLTLKNLADIIWTDTDGDLTVDPFPQDGGYLPRILVNARGALNPSDNTISAADGAEFNVRTCGVGHYDHEDGSYGAHNKFLCEALLSASASFLRTTYTFLPAPPAELQAVWDKWSRPVATGGAGQPVIKREAFPAMQVQDR